MRRRFDKDADRQLLFHRLDVADDADRAATRAQVVEGPQRELEGLGIQRSEPLIDEQRVKPDAARAARDDLCQAQGKSE